MKVRKLFDVPADQRFLDTEYVVDATAFEQQAIWEDYHERVEWTEELAGLIRTIGYLGDRPTAVMVSWAVIFGKRVAFVDPTSQLVDYVLVEEWRGVVFPRTRVHSDAMNFHNVMADICRETGRKVKP